MKRSLEAIALTTLLLAANANADQVRIYTDTLAPFSCRHGEEILLERLTRYCQKIEQKLSKITYGACTYDSDDGGYVLYYNISAEGSCSY